ncbi:MAG: hypothetical protein IKB06_00215 [Clostridia bacterium]|nr:hypothetical protein [Clostridia bacterium]
MANSNINIVDLDDSNCDDKYNALQSFDYMKRTRWERAAVVDVLPDDSLYLDFINMKKKAYAKDVGLSPWGNIVDATFYTDPNYGQLLFATVATRKDDSTSSPISAFLGASGERENSVFASVFPNVNSSIESTKSSARTSVLHSIQLFRYDPTGRFNHPNHPDIYNYYMQAGGQQLADLYQNYFEPSVGFPHFHFINRTMAETYGKTSESDAISLDKLIEYVEDLIMMKLQKKRSPLNLIDFGMPYLRIMEHPETYTTFVDFNNLYEALRNNTVNKQLSQIFTQTQNASPTAEKLTGLEAVYADLALLRLLRNGGSGQVKNSEEESMSSGGTDPSGGGSDDGSGGGFGGSGGGSHDGGREMRSVEPDTGTVSHKELEVASKVASGNKMKLKTPAGMTKRDIEEEISGLNIELDDKSYSMLMGMLELREISKKRGDDSNGPKRD